MRLPSGEKELLRLTNETIEICSTSRGRRSSAYSVYGQWIETGKNAGGLGLANLLYSHIDRLASHLFSPTDLRFNIGFDNKQAQNTLKQAEVGARQLSRMWAKNCIDLVFSDGVKAALSYGAAIPKLLATNRGDGSINISSRLVMPWNFGVYDEAVNGLRDQEAVLETVYITKHEAWRRIRHLPNAEKLYKRIASQASKEQGAGQPTSFMHQVLSTAVLDVSLENATNPTPGGIVQLSNNPNFAMIGPEVATDLIPMHELYLRDDERDQDYTTVQMIEPDILIAPTFKKINLFCPKNLPYTLIQPNSVRGYFWGRSEIVDLMKLQNFLTTTLDDIKRVLGIQIDKLLAFPGYDGMTDELYGQFRSQGFIGMPPGSDVKDLTPQLPQQALEVVNMIIKLMEMVSGFHNILSGQGEPGVRAGVHADTLMKAASPRLRDRALIVERQCAEHGDSTFACMQAKDGKTYWWDEDQTKGTEFLLENLPDDRYVLVDSHSSSPIFQEDNENLIAFGLKAQIIDGETAIEQLPFQNKDLLLQRLKDRQQQQAAMVAAHPELLTGGKKKSAA